MNNEIIIAIIIAVVIVAAFIAAAKFPKARHAFLVPEGYAGLLYHKGRFLRMLGAGRHIRWGRHFTLDAQDLRKASLLVAGQEVLNADNVGLKLSLLVTYQVTDPAKAGARHAELARRPLHPALMNVRLMQSLTAAQNAGSTLVLGVPGFVPLKNGKAGSPATNTEESGAS